MNYRNLSKKDFKPEKLLGAGQYGEVFLATAPDGLEVALKLPKPEVLQDRGLSQRFTQEVALSLSLFHQYLIKGIAGYPMGEGAFLALEYFPQGSLEDRLVEGMLPREEALSYLDQLAQALLYLDSRGVVHQDIKPANLYLAGKTMKLGDFGVAKVRENPKPLERAGSPFYMAPELFRGEMANLASDTYSFGILAYELLIGRRPFRGDTVEELMSAHLDQSPAPTSLPKDLERMVRKLLAKNPAERANLRDYVQYRTMPQITTSITTEPKVGFFGRLLRRKK